MSIDIEDIEGSPEKPDFRRANGAPMIIDKDGKNQRFSRPSGWGKQLDDENALVNWKIDTAAKGVAGDSSLQARIVALKDDDRKGKADLREAAIQAGRGNTASDTGTALHSMSERWEDPDDDFNPPDKYRASLEAYSTELDRLGLVSELMEYTVANTEYRAAGTCDRLYRLTRPLITPKGTTLPVGTLVIGDLKTGKKLDFSLPGYHVQMALYAQGEFYDVVQDKFMPTPDINADWGLLVHMPAEGDDAGKCSIIWCDLEVGNYGAYLVNEIKDWRRKWNNGTYDSPVVETPQGKTVEAEVAETLIDVFDAIEVDPEVEEHVVHIKAKLKAIGEDEKAKKRCQTFWPDVPPPSKIETLEQAQTLMTFLDGIEAEFGIGFVADDPRTESVGRRKYSQQTAGGSAGVPKINVPGAKG